MNDYIFWTGLFAICLTVLIILPPTRAVLGWFVKSGGLFSPIIYVVHMVVMAHKVVIRNLGPRILVLPSLNKQRTEEKK